MFSVFFFCLGSKSFGHDADLKCIGIGRILFSCMEGKTKSPTSNNSDKRWETGAHFLVLLFGIWFFSTFFRDLHIHSSWIMLNFAPVSFAFGLRRITAPWVWYRLMGNATSVIHHLHVIAICLQYRKVEKPRAKSFTHQNRQKTSSNKNFKVD